MSIRSHQKDTRRKFITRALVLSSMLTFCSSCGRNPHSRLQQAARIVGGGCDGCEGMYDGMPGELSWRTAISSASESGDRMEISGIILKPGGKTPAPDVILYVYQTDANGYYSPAPNSTGFARTHGHLRGWLKTNERGEYKFATIRPAPYPNADIPAHIHPTIKEPDKNEYYIDDYEFEDDRLLTNQQRSSRLNRGGSGIISVTRTAGGTWVGNRNIVLGLNIPDYVSGNRK